MKKTLHKILFSHIAIAVIVLLTIIPLIGHTLRSEREKQVKASYSLVSGDIGTLSTSFSSAESMIGALHRNPSIRSIINMDGELTGAQRYHAAESRKTWYATTASWNILRNNYVYFARNDIVFSPDRIFFSWEDSYDYWLRYEGVDCAQWRERLEREMQASRRGFRPVEQVFTYSPNGQSGYADTITYSFPFVDPFNSGMVVCLIDVAELLRALRFDSLLTDSFLCLYDSTGQLLLSHKAPYAVTAQAQDVSEMSISGQSHHVFTITDAASGLTYVIGTPSSFFNRDFISSFGMLFGYTIIAFLAAFVVSVLLTKRQYSPIKEVYSFFKQHSSVPSSTEYAKDEYQYFLSSYKELLQSNHSIRNTIADYDAALTTRAMEDLLYGRYKNERDMQKLCARIALPDMWRACNAVLESECAVEKAALGVISVTLVDMLEKSWKEKLLIHPLSEKRLLFIMPTEQDGSAVSIAERLNAIVNTLRSDTGVEAFFAISGVYCQPEDVAHAYEETKSILGCRHAVNSNILFPEDVERSDELPILTMAASNKLREYVMAGDTTRSEEFIRSYLQNRYLRDRDYGQLFSSIRGILLQIAADSTSIGEDELPFFAPTAPRDEQTGELVDACHALCSSFNDRRKSYNEQLKNDLLTYLEENYADPDVYGKSVAAHFSISEKYLSTFFREQTGVGFSSYLENLRLTQAAHLLDDSQFTVNEIANMVGFNSPNTFYKAFRRMYGIAPSAYRNTPRAQ